MGNLLRANKAVVVPEESLQSSKRKQIHENNKVVRFQLDGDDSVYVEKVSSSATGLGVIKFRIVVNREELINILKGSRYSSMEELLEGMKVTSKNISHVKIDSEEVSLQKWKLALQNIADC